MYVLLNVGFTQFYKINTKYSKDGGALTVLLQLLGGIVSICLCPIFGFKVPTDWKVYFFLIVACIFYAISDRVNTTVRGGIEASTFSIIQQLSTVFMVLAGLFFFKEALVWKKIIGAALIVFGNILTFYTKGSGKFNKYVVMGILANIAYTIGLFLDVNLSGYFNLALYVTLTLLISPLFLMAAERIGPARIMEEFRIGNKKALIATGFCWGVMLVFQLKAYQLGDVTSVAPICALTILGNVVAGFIFLKEKNNLPRKLVAAILIIISVILIKG